MTERLCSLLSGVVLPAALTLLSVFFLFYLKGGPFRPGARGRGKERKRGSTGALFMALAGTLGVGNITGVADALRRGGAGVLFWMWVSALAAMVIKYAEILLIMRTKYRLLPGRTPSPTDYMQPAAAVTFAAAGMFCAFSVGTSLQSAAVSSAFSSSFGLPPAVGALALGGVSLFFVLRGKKTLFALTSILIPACSAIYLFLCLSVIVKYAGGLPAVMERIFREAFDFRCAGIGLSCGGMTALRYGVIRGLLSNEAGCGTAPIAHAHARTMPETQARLGVTEVAVDTLLLCSATGFALLLRPTGAADPTAAVKGALSSVFGGAARTLLPVALFCFALGTVLCWSLYAEVFFSRLFPACKPTGLALLRALFCSGCALCLFVPEGALWQVADLSVSVMTLINLYYLFRNKKTIEKTIEI